MFKEKIAVSFMLILLFVVWGCGTMAKDDDKISVPQDVSLEMPKALSSETKKSKKRKKSLSKEDNRSSAYLELKEDVGFLEEKRVELELNLLFVNEVIETIERRCKEVDLEERCSIEEDVLTFVIDENLSKKIEALTHEPSQYELGDELLFGAVELVKHSKALRYQYSLKMDTSFDDTAVASSETISWSKDEKKILSFYEEESSEFKKEIRIDFVKKENQEKQIVVEDGFIDKVEKRSDVFHFDLLKKPDVDETYQLSSKSSTVDADFRLNSFVSSGELSNKGGYLNFEGSFDGETFKERETFDENGLPIDSFYCWSDMNCDLEDEGSWLRF